MLPLRLLISLGLEENIYDRWHSCWLGWKMDWKDDCDISTLKFDLINNLYVCRVEGYHFCVSSFSNSLLCSSFGHFGFWGTIFCAFWWAAPLLIRMRNNELKRFSTQMAHAYIHFMNNAYLVLLGIIFCMSSYSNSLLCPVSFDQFNLEEQFAVLSDWWHSCWLEWKWWVEEMIVTDGTRLNLISWTTPILVGLEKCHFFLSFFSNSLLLSESFDRFGL